MLWSDLVGTNPPRIRIGPYRRGGGWDLLLGPVLYPLSATSQNTSTFVTFCTKARFLLEFGPEPDPGPPSQFDS